MQYTVQETFPTPSIEKWQGRDQPTSLSQVRLDFLSQVDSLSFTQEDTVSLPLSHSYGVSHGLDGRITFRIFFHLLPGAGCEGERDLKHNLHLIFSCLLIGFLIVDQVDSDNGNDGTNILQGCETLAKEYESAEKRTQNFF